jgi:hypothetical protein
MTITYVDAVSEQLPATDTTIYTCPSSGVGSSHIIYANATCEDATGDDITINIVKSGGAVAVSNQYLQARAIAAGATEVLSEVIGAVLKPGDFISAKATTASRINLKLSIKEIT